MSKPNFIMMVGLPGSGKSTYAQTIGANIHSSDAIREEILGDVYDQKHNNDVFTELHKRVKDDLRNGNDAIYDATNITSKYRIAFLKELNNINCYKTCVLMATSYEDCKNRISLRDRHVPVHVLDYMYKNFCPPNYYEGWDEIRVIVTESDSTKNYTNEKLYDPINGIDNFDQGNDHHKLTLGEHCRKAAKYVRDHYPQDTLLYDAAILHDEGKQFTKSKYNGKGKFDGNYHYYQHHCVGAYNSIFYLYNAGYPKDDILYISSLIYYHMHPYLQWKDSEKKREYFKILLGENMFLDIIHLHEGDVYAH